MTTRTKQATLRDALLPMLAPGLTGDQRVALAFTYERPEPRAVLLGVTGVTADQVGAAFGDPAVREAARMMMDCQPLLDRPRMAQQVLVGLAIAIARSGEAPDSREALAEFLRQSTDPRTCALHDAGAAMMDELAKMDKIADRLQGAIGEMAAGLAAAREALSGDLEGELSELSRRVLDGAPFPANPGGRTVH